MKPVHLNHAAKLSEQLGPPLRGTFSLPAHAARTAQGLSPGQVLWLSPSLQQEADPLSPGGAQERSAQGLCGNPETAGHNLPGLRCGHGDCQDHEPKTMGA